MAKQLNVNLAFTANTAQAREQIQSLQNQLQQLTTQQAFKNNFTLTGDLQKSFAVATQLKQSLNDAVNVNTGKLDLGRFAASMKQNNMSLEKYRAALNQLGPQGTQAFASLANSITQAEMPIRRSNSLLTNMFTTLKNAARWQISSSILHGFMGTIQHAHRYAQDLNESLNNIRIITGQSVDEMARFAEQANKAARALSTTTTEYTNASLIYYQQGLTGAEVQERTEATIKMANVTSQSAQVVSDQMTAIWNNFDDGSKSLEYYADVMTALGAATASSTTEIATGLEKFAAVAETVGLSYEYATAALATVTATTRQSADVVGNAFKTLFARIQGLNLGETLDDGTTLNKYSQALEKVGISIKDQNGQMKEMDTILSEMGAKWDTLDKDQQTALAQAVAGVRQYTQLVALMDNWDFFEENLDVAKGAEGTLNEQAEIYAESWEAARDRVKASAESIYSVLLNDKFFIGLNNGFSKFLDTIKNTMDSLGGLKGVLLVLGGVLTTTFSDKAAQSVNNLLYSIKMLTKAGRDSVAQLRNESNQQLQQLVINKNTASGQALSSAYQNQGVLQQAYIDNALKMSEAQKAVAVSMLDQQRTLIENVRLQGEALTIAENQEAVEKRRAIKRSSNIIIDSNDKSSAAKYIAELDQVAQKSSQISQVFNNLGNVNIKTPEGIEQFKIAIDSAKLSVKDFQLAFGDNANAVTAFQNLQNALNSMDTNKAQQALEALWNEIIDGSPRIESLKQEILNLVPESERGTEGFKKLEEALNTLTGAAERTGQAQGELAQKSSLLTSYTQNVAKAYQELVNKQQTAGQSFVALSSQLSSIAMGISSVVNLIKTWNNEDLSAGEKLLSTLMTLGLVIPIVTRAFSPMNIAMLGTISASIAAALGLKPVKIELTETGTAAYFAAGGLASFLAPLLIVAGIAAAVGLTIWALVKAYNANADAAKEAAEANREAKEAFENTKTAVEELKSSLQGIDEQKAAIDAMTRGTDEWREAVMALNDEVLSLVNTYPELAAAIEDNNGVLGIDKQSEAYKDFIKTQERQLQNSRQAYLGTAIDLNNKNNQSDITDFSRKITYTDEWDAPQQASEKEIQEIVKLLQNSNSAILKNKETFSQSLKDAGFDNQPLINALWDNKQSLMELTSAVTANTTANDVFNQQIAQSYLESESKEYSQSKNKAAMEQAASEGLSQEDTSDWGKNYKGMTDKQIQKEYAEAMGLNWVKNKNGGVGEYVNAKGETVEVKDSTARFYLNQQDALERNKDRAIAVDELLKSNQGTKDQQALFNAALTKNYKSLTEDQLALDMSAEELLSSMGFDSDEIASLTTLLGEEFIASLQAALDATKDSIPEVPFDLQSWTEQFNLLKDLNVGDTISPEDFAKLDEGMQQFFTKTLDGEYMLIAAADELTRQLSDDLITETESQLKQLGEAGNAAKGYYSTIGESAYNKETNTYNSKRVQAQLDFLDTQNVDTSAWRSDLQDDNRLSAEVLQEIADAAAAAKIELDGLEASIRGNQEALAQMGAEISVDKITEFASTGLISEQDYEEYQSAAYINEAQEHDFDLESLEAYANTLKDNIEVLEEYKDTIGNTMDSEEEQIKTAKKIALAHKKMNKGLQDLADNWEDWSKNLDPKKAGTKEYSEALAGVKEAMADILDLDLDDIPDSLASSAEAAELLERAVQGDMTAIDDLRMLAGEKILIEAGVDTAEAQQAMTALQADMAAIPDLEIGATVDISQALPSLWQLYEQGKITADDLQAALNSIGWEPNITYTTMTVAQAKGFYQTAQLIGPDGSVQTIDLQNYADDNAIVQVPVLTSATYKGSGAGTAAPPKPSGSGGGGGKQPKHAEKKNDSDKTRYHTLQNQLEDLKSEYEEIAEVSDRAFGQDKLDAIDDEIKKTDELIAKQEEYLDAISADLPIDKETMEAYYDDVIGGPAIQFDEKGNISNYDEIQDAMFKKYNEMTAYDEESEEWKVFEKKYEQLEKYIEQYEETYDLLRDEEKEYQDLLNQRIDAQLKKIQYQIELKLNIADDGLALLDFQLNNLEDKAFKAAEAIELFGDKSELLYDKMQSNKEGLDNILGQSLSNAEIKMFYDGDMGVLQNKSFTEDQIEAIKEYRDNLLDLAEELQEVREEVQGRLLDAFDQWNEELDEGIEKFDHYNSLMENYKNIIDIVGKDYLKVNNSMLGNLSQAMVENNINRVYATRDALKALTETEIQARQAYEEALARGNENDILYWEETLKVIGDEVSDAQEEMMQAWEDALQSAAEAFEAAVEAAIENFEKALLPFGTLEQFSDAYEKQQELADQYLDDYKQIYELSKLNRDIANSMDDTKSIAGKQKLKGLMDDINKLQEEGTQLSEYDLEYLQKTYDLRMAEIALEEAQKAKDTVRLTRDNEGNWSYAYTTNTDAADDAAQKYEDALYAMQELSSEYIDEMSEQLISTSQEMEEALAAVRVEDYASIEEYYKKLDEIQQYYLDRMTFMQGEMQKALDNNKALYEQDWQNYSNATGYKISDDEKFAMSYKDTVLGTLFGSESDIVDFQQRVNEALGTSDSGLIGELLDAYLQWSENTDNAMIAAGTSSEGFADDMDQAVHGDGGIVDSSTAATDAVNDMANQMVAGFDTITNAVVRWQSQVGDAADAVINDYLDTVEAFNLMVATLSSTKGNDIAENDLTDIVTSRAESTVDVASMDTGGYTGAWGPEGKFLLAHEKELILNSEDTKNLLSAVHLTREMLNTIDINARQASIGFGTLSAGFIKEESNSTLEQQVHITAEFPNVTDHYEVEEALNNLINTSSQYANRK